MRKIIISILCIAALIACAVPALALSNSTGTVRYSPVTFDTITFDFEGWSGSNVAYPWPFNYVQTGTQQADAIYNEVMYAEEGDLADGVFCEIHARGLNSGRGSIVIENKAPQYLYLDDVRSIRIARYGGDLEQISVRVSFEVAVPVVNADGYYELQYTAVNKGVSYSSDGSLLLGDAIYDGCKSVSPHAYALIRNLVVSVNTEASANGGNGIFFEYVSVGSRSAGATSWFQIKRLATESGGNPAYFDVTEWLSNAVGGFLSFEIAPGFSIDMIFGVIMVIGVILAIITLLI